MKVLKNEYGLTSAEMTDSGISNDEPLCGFTEFERNGLLGKIILYFDNGPQIEVISNGWGDANNKKEILDSLFSQREQKQLLALIIECEKYGEIRNNCWSIQLFLTKKNIKKIYNYLRTWRNKYWSSEPMDGFLCDFIKKIRKNKIKTSMNILNNKQLPLEIIGNIQNYIGKSGGKKTRYKIKKNKRRTIRITQKK